jgi:hypothetical protein
MRNAFLTSTEKYLLVARYQSTLCLQLLLAASLHVPILITLHVPILITLHVIAFYSLSSLKLVSVLLFVGFARGNDGDLGGLSLCFTLKCFCSSIKAWDGDIGYIGWYSH